MSRIILTCSRKSFSRELPYIPYELTDEKNFDLEDYGVQHIDYCKYENPVSGESKDEARIRRFKLHATLYGRPDATFKMDYEIAGGANHRLSEKVIFKITSRIIGAAMCRDVRSILDTARVAVLEDQLEDFYREARDLAHVQRVRMTKKWYFNFVKWRFHAESLKAAKAIEEWFATYEWYQNEIFEDAARSIAQRVKNLVRDDLQNPNPDGEHESDEEEMGSGMPFCSSPKEENEGREDAVLAPEENEGGEDSVLESVMEQITKEIAHCMKWEAKEDLLDHFKMNLKCGLSPWRNKHQNF